MGVQDYESIDMTSKSVKNIKKDKASLEQAYNDLYMNIEYTNQTVNLATDYCNFLLNEVGRRIPFESNYSTKKDRFWRIDFSIAQSPDWTSQSPI